MKTLRKTLASLPAVACLLALAPSAQATPWQYPDEISVAHAYNTLYGTAYDEASMEGLDLLLTDHGAAMQTSWTLNEIDSLTVLVFDTSSTAELGLLVNGTDYFSLLAPGPWTPPSRGLIHDPGAPDFESGLIDLTAFAGAGDSFAFTVGGAGGDVLGAGNTVRIDGLIQGEFLLGYNDAGISGGDADLNEPLLYVNPGGGAPPAVPEPNALLLFATGFVGLAAFNRGGRRR